MLLGYLLFTSLCPSSLIGIIQTEIPPEEIPWKQIQTHLIQAADIGTLLPPGGYFLELCVCDKGTNEVWKLKILQKSWDAFLAVHLSFLIAHFLAPQCFFPPTTSPNTHCRKFQESSNYPRGTVVICLHLSISFSRSHGFVEQSHVFVSLAWPF